MKQSSTSLFVLFSMWSLHLLQPVDCFFFQNPASAFSNSKSKKLTKLQEELNQLIEQSQNGVDASYKPQITELMVAIGAEARGTTSRQDQDQRKQLPGSWELIYTTEQEVNFFKTSWPFATVSSITQTIDPYGSQTIQNSINFSGGGKFVVQGSVVPIETTNNENENESIYDRVEFEFKTAEILAWDKSISIPPVGSGWFDTIYCDEQCRLSTDVRGDWSVFKRIP